jgi:hypothetical protein
MPCLFISYAATSVHVFDAPVTTLAHGVDLILPTKEDISIPVKITAAGAVAVPSLKTICNPVGSATALAVTVGVPSANCIASPVTDIIESAAATAIPKSTLAVAPVGIMTAVPVTVSTPVVEEINKLVGSAIAPAVW